jgi:hypothetical protein
MTKLNKRLIAGPWIGEFGWELFAWQGYIRSLAENFDETIIACRPSSRAIYSDFANDFIDLDPPNGLSDSFFMHGVDLNLYVKQVLIKHKDLLGKGTSIFAPRRIGFPPNTHFSEEIRVKDFLIKPRYIRFGLEEQRKYEYVFHIRDRDLRKEDNWSLDNWKKLFNLLTTNGERVACVGTLKESGIIEGVDDFRGKPLDQVFNILRNCKTVFGPSSGPMHLSSLCGAPHVVWSIDANNLRYNTNWNPLSTPVLFLSEHEWHPTPEYIFERFQQWKI